MRKKIRVSPHPLGSQRGRGIQMTGTLPREMHIVIRVVNYKGVFMTLKFK